MDMVENPILKRIIRDKLLGNDLLSEEESVFEQWLQSSPDNRRAFDIMVRGRIAEDYADALSQITVPDKILEVRGKIRRVLRRRKMARLGTAAAVLVIGIISIVSLNNSHDKFADLVTTEQTPRAILSVSGGNTVQLSESEQGEGWKKHVEEADRLIKITVPLGGDYRLQLDDGSQVWLNAESTIEYRANFSGGRREIKLTGEAYFEVTKNADKPFAVMAVNAEIVVLGTSFNVSAYEGDGAVTTTLLEGAVEVVSAGRSAKLLPGKQAVIDADGSISVSEVNTALYTSWTKGAFEFENMALKDICKRLSRWYGVEFDFEGGAGDEKISGGTWMSDPLEDLLKNIELAADVKFTVKNGKVVVAPRR